MSFCVTGAGHQTLFHPRGRSGTSCTLLKCGQARVRMRGAFGGHFAWQAQSLVNLEDVLQGSKVSFCATVVIFDFGQDDFIWQVHYFRPRQKNG